MEEGKDYHVPSILIVCMDFSPSYESRRLTKRYSGALTIKLATQNKNNEAVHSHYHYASHQNNLMYNQAVQGCNQLEREGAADKSSIKFDWKYYVEILQ